MATYTRPGVYIEEHLDPVSDLSAFPGQAVAAFVGTSSDGGPIGPTLISSWAQFQALFGISGNTNDDLAYAVYLYFANGGSPCYVSRAVNADATPATLDAEDTEGTPEVTLTVQASAPGSWSSDPDSNSRVFVTIQPNGTINDDRWDLIIEVGSGSTLAARETFTDLTMDPNDGRYAIDVVNSPLIGSQYVSLVDAGIQTFTNGVLDSDKQPAALSKAALGSSSGGDDGTDGTGTPDLIGAVDRLSTLDLDLIVNIPSASASVITDAVTWAETSTRHFIVADVPKPASGESSSASVTAISAFIAACPKSSYLAIYGPWLWIQDPQSRVGSQRLTAPGGAVVGQYVHTDALQGPWKAPAGVLTTLAAVVSPYVSYTDDQQDSLYGLALNLIRVIPGSQTVIWGTRTQAYGYPDRFIPIRRTLIAIEQTLKARTRFAVFQNNDEYLWAQVTDVCVSYLNGLLAVRGLRGSRNSEAFFVTCDSTNNTAQTINSGIVNIDVGVALQNPAEFIVIRIGQTASGTTITDQLGTL